MSETEIVPDTTEELDDVSAFRGVVRGAIGGFFAMFVIVLFVCKLADMDWVESAIVAFWPAVVGGPFFGALFGLGHVVHERELATVTPVALAAPRETVARAA